MTLQDLVVSNKQISAELVENILKGRVELIQDGRKVNLSKESINLPNRSKILLFLVGGKAWELLDGDAWSFLPSAMEEALGIPGNTLRPILKELADGFFVKSEKGQYQILSKGIYELETLIQKVDSRVSEVNASNRYQKQEKVITARKPLSSPSKSKAIDELIKEGYFSSSRDLTEIQTELGRRGITTKLTSLPSYLLPLVRSKVLTRDYKDKGQRKVWAYIKS